MGKTPAESHPVDGEEMKGTYIGGIVFAICFITASAIVMNIPASAQSENLVVFSESVSEDDKIPTEEAGWSKTGQIREDSGMPCINPEQFERWYETYEPQPQTEEEESSQWVVVAETAESEQEVREIGVGTVETVLYSVNGETLNPDIQAYLYQRLADHGIEWFMPYAIMIAYQESHFDQYDVSDDGKDYGLLQFRAEFWDWNRGDIFDPYAQIDVFAENMANRANMGLDVYEMISRHMQSDWGSYNHEYVSDVLSHETNLREVSK